MNIFHNRRDLDMMRKAGRLVAEAHYAVREAVKPGVTLLQLDAIAEKVITKGGGKPAFKGYVVGGLTYPSTLCTSANEEVVHGIPSRRKLEEGDIISIDCGTIVSGYYGDRAVTLPVGKVAPEAQQLIEVTEACLFAGIAAARAGNHVNAIGSAIEDFIAPYGYGIVRDFVGHGIGKKLHDTPQVTNFRSEEPGPKMVVGLMLAIEPMINLGTHEVVTRGDGWTVVTKDGKWSAHYEHTIRVTEGEPELISVESERDSGKMLAGAFA